MNYPKNLKYPEAEYKNLLIVLKQLKPYFELEKIQVNQVHYLAYQQTKKNNQAHNIIYKTNEGLKRAHKLESTENLKPIVNVDFELELYPNNCNDNHIETATKKAIKELYN